MLNPKPQPGIVVAVLSFHLITFLYPAVSPGAALFSTIAVSYGTSRTVTCSAPKMLLKGNLFPHFPDPVM